MNGASRVRWRALFAVAAQLASLSACDPEAPSATEVTVTVTSHAEVAPRLRRIRASVYESDARDGGLPVQTQDFVLSADLDAGVQAKLPFSFGITPGRSARFLLVIEGFDSLDPAKGPIVEQKQIGAFTADRAMATTVLLSARCFDMYDACVDLTQTCWPEARACGPLREAPTIPAPDPRGMDAGALPTITLPGCPADACDPNHPCTPTPPDGYVCLGARADYPMPYFGSKTPPSYDLSEPGIAVDRVTGLAWQRESPARYEGCSGDFSLPGDMCTLDEAKRYCARLQLGERSWRLPTAPELDSLLDFHVATYPLLDHDVFPGTLLTYWTSSTVPGRFPSGLYMTDVWSFDLGSKNAHGAYRENRVRCVSGVPLGRGTPAQRFVVDERADTVSDRTTTLTWQRSPAALASSADEARAICNALGPDWRVPHPKELMGILDARAVIEGLPAVFPQPAQDSTWTEFVGSDGQLQTVMVRQVWWLFGLKPAATGLVRCVR